MNSLSKEVVSAIYGIPKSSFPDDTIELAAFRKKVVNAWKTFRVKGGTLRKEHQLLYAVLLGRDWRKCFTPITNKKKLENGCRPHEAAYSAFYSLSSPYSQEKVLEPFVGVVNPVILKRVADIIHRPDFFAAELTVAYDSRIAGIMSGSGAKQAEVTSV